MVENKLVRAYGDLDTLRNQDRSNEIGDQITDPTDRAGDRIAKPEDDEQAQVEKLRNKFHREGTDAVEKAGKAAGRVKDILARPPTGHPETRTGPTVTQAQRDGIDVADTTTALLATGIVIYEAGRWINGKLRPKGGRGNGRDR